MDPQDPNERFSPEELQRDMDAIASGKFVDLSRVGLPKYQFDPDVVRFLLAIPLFFLWLAVKDPFCGWNRWRAAGVVLGVLTTAAMFAALVLTSVQHELGGPFGLAEDSQTFLLLQNIGTGGLAAVIFFLWPRTIILITAVFAVLSGINYIL